MTKFSMTAGQHKVLIVVLTALCSLWLPAAAHTETSAAYHRQRPTQAAPNQAVPDHTTTQHPLPSAQEWRALRQQQRTLRRQIDDLLTLTRNGAAPQALHNLHTMAADTQRPALERDALVYGYATSLRQLTAEQAGPDVVHWLENYTAQRWRPHEESPALRLPVFNVSAAIAGTRNEWAYRAGAELALSTTQNTTPIPAPTPTNNAVHHDQPHNNWILQQYAHGNLAFRRGFESSLQQLSPAQVRQLQQAAMAHGSLHQSTLAGYLAHLNDRYSGTQISDFGTWLAQAPAASAISVLREVAADYSSAEQRQLYRRAMAHDDPRVYAAALAQAATLWQNSADPASAEWRRHWRDELRAQLAHPQRGAAAAMHLARLVDDATLARWRTEAAQILPGTPLLQQRLQLIQRLRSGITAGSGPTEGQP